MILTTFDFPTFDEVRNPTLRTWNRLNIMFNMKEIFGPQSRMALNYLKKFSAKDQTDLAKLAIIVNKNGYENTRREIVRNNNAR